MDLAALPVIEQIECDFDLSLRIVFVPVFERRVGPAGGQPQAGLWRHVVFDKPVDDRGRLEPGAGPQHADIDAHGPHLRVGDASLCLTVHRQSQHACHYRRHTNTHRAQSTSRGVRSLTLVASSAYAKIRPSTTRAKGKGQRAQGRKGKREKGKGTGTSVLRLSPRTSINS